MGVLNRVMFKWVMIEIAACPSGLNHGWTTSSSNTFFGLWDISLQLKSRSPKSVNGQTLLDPKTHVCRLGQRTPADLRHAFGPGPSLASAVIRGVKRHSWRSGPADGEGGGSSHSFASENCVRNARKAKQAGNRKTEESSRHPKPHDSHGCLGFPVEGTRRSANSSCPLCLPKGVNFDCFWVLKKGIAQIVARGSNSRGLQSNTND